MPAKKSIKFAENRRPDVPAAKFQRKPLADRVAKLADELVPKAWYDAVVTSCDLTVAATGNEGWTMALELRHPLYGGRMLYFRSYSNMTKGREVLAERFPGVDWNDSDDIQDALLGELVRVNVGIEEAVGQYKAKNRVLSIAPKTR